MCVCWEQLPPYAKHFAGGIWMETGREKKKGRGKDRKETTRAPVLQVALFCASVTSLHYSGSACSSAQAGSQSVSVQWLAQQDLHLGALGCFCKLGYKYTLTHTLSFHPSLCFVNSWL